MSQSENELLGQKTVRRELPIGAQIICVVRSYDRLVREVSVRESHRMNSDEELIDELRRDMDTVHSDEVLDALERVVSSKRIPTGLVLAEV